METTRNIWEDTGIFQPTKGLWGNSFEENPKEVYEEVEEELN